IQPDELMMVGNSLKSDIIPVLNVGGYGVHVPYHITWAHEQIEDDINNERFRSIIGISDILEFL
ncbi:MAG: HAD family hydrolase, partial [Sphingobacteriales bacterium]